MFRILMVENDITHANVTACGIQDLRFGVDVKFALSAAQALLFLAGTRSAKKNLPDMVLMDAKLPDTEGLDFLRTLAKALAQEATPILVTSKSTDPKLAAEYYKVGAAAYIPFSDSIDDYKRAVADSVAFVAMLSGLVPKQQRFLPAESRTEPTISEVLQVYL